jgi:protein-tyrosine phosphatase
MRRVLVVCKANICRSPMAEVLLRHRVPDIQVASAGLAAVDGCPIDPDVERVLAAHGLTGRAHVSRRIDASLIGEADLVLAMERRHVAALLALSPSLRGKAFVLSHRQDGSDIEDPYGRRQTAFDHAYERIDSCIRDWFPES